MVPGGVHRWLRWSGGMLLARVMHDRLLLIIHLGYTCFLALWSSVFEIGRLLPLPLVILSAFGHVLLVMWLCVEPLKFSMLSLYFLR